MKNHLSTASWLTFGVLICSIFNPCPAAAGAQSPRTAIAWPMGCARPAGGENDYRFERACAEALSSFADWPKPDSEGGCFDYAGGYEGSQASGLPAPKFLPFDRRGRFLIELDCGSGAYNPRKFYLLYDETHVPATLTRLRFPYRAFASETDPDAPVPALTESKTIGTRAYDARRHELIALVKFRGMGDCGVFARYRFHGDRPFIHEMRAKTSCDGHGAYEVRDSDTPSPGEWTLIPGSDAP